MYFSAIFKIKFIIIFSITVLLKISLHFFPIFYISINIINTKLKLIFQKHIKFIPKWSLYKLEKKIILNYFHLLLKSSFHFLLKYETYLLLPCIM